MSAIFTPTAALAKKEFYLGDIGTMKLLHTTTLLAILGASASVAQDAQIDRTILPSHVWWERFSN